MTAVTPFHKPQDAVAGLDPQAAADLIAAAADVTLIIDGEGVVRDIAFGSQDLEAEGYASWIGKPWVETVTVESRPKVAALLRDAGSGGATRRRQVNHPSAQGDVPILYGTVKVGDDGRIVAVGRDLRAVSALQQRLVRAQQSMEMDYGRLRQAELRYRLLFQIASEAVLVLDCSTLKVVEANPAAARILGKPADDIQGASLTQFMSVESVGAVRGLLERAAAAGAIDDVQVRVPNYDHPFTVTVSLLRQDKVMQALVRLVPVAQQVPVFLPGTSNESSARSRLLEVVTAMPDGFVVTDPQGLILAANPAFMDLVHAATEDVVRGRPLQQWLGRGAVDLNVLLVNLRDHGSIRLYATTLKDAHGGSVDVEISAVSVPKAGQPCIGFAIRHIGRRMTKAIGEEKLLPQSVQQLAELVGRVPMKDIVRETTDLIETMCIEAALHLTGDNRASAAEILGLSRQSLYVKLHRHGIGGIGQDEG
ncbi:MAG: transcriptional regulator PpsR [Gammaproteobacteria bacterium]